MLMLAVGIVVLAVAAVVLSAPLVLHRLEPYAVATPERAESGEADRLLEALSDLEHSRQAGKLSDADYSAQRDRLEQAYVRAAEAGGDAV